MILSHLLNPVNFIGCSQQLTWATCCESHITHEFNLNLKWASFVVQCNPLYILMKVELQLTWDWELKIVGGRWSCIWLSFEDSWSKAVGQGWSSIRASEADGGLSCRWKHRVWVTKNTKSFIEFMGEEIVSVGLRWSAGKQSMRMEVWTSYFSWICSWRWQL